jgi:hypothetical protein
MDALLTALAPMVNAGSPGTSPGQLAATNTRLGLDKLFSPLLKLGLPFRKFFDLLSLVKLVKIPGVAGFGRDASSLLFYSLLPSMLPTLMATGLFLYGGTMNELTLPNKSRN